MWKRRKAETRLRWSQIAAVLAVVVFAPGNAALADNEDWSEETNLVVVPDGGDKRNERGALSAKTALDNTLESIGEGLDLTTRDKNSNKAKIDAIEASAMTNAPANGVVGLGGVNSYLFMWAAAKALAGNADLDLSEPHEIRVFGKIRRYKFDANATDPTKGSGKIRVVTGIRYWPTNKLTGARIKSQKQVFRFRYDIEIERNGFKVIKRDDTNPKRPFPTSGIVFDDEMIEKLDDRGYEYKLHARGKKIKIMQVSYRENQGAWVDIPKSDNTHKYHSLYSEVKENCIDILFVNKPPATKAGLRTTPAYCMGRCESPMIVNTGM